MRLLPEPDAGRAEAARAATRLHGLDVVRGFGALAIVFWHWQHFFFNGGILSKTYNPESMPFGSMLSGLYRYGYLAVDLFFILSGYIFFWLYRNPISHGTISPRNFFVLRFSRIYPLFFTSLLLVSVLQIIYVIIYGVRFVYVQDDLFHFILNLFLMAGVGFEKFYSFNGPAWSISVEAMLYAFFFCFARYMRGGFVTWSVLAVLIVGGVALQDVLPNMGRGIYGFFMGGVIALVSLAIRERRVDRYALSLGLLALALSCATFIVLLNENVRSALQIDLSAIGGRVHSVAGVTEQKLVNTYFMYCAFPLIIFVLGLGSEYVDLIARQLGFLGDASYSVYLLHFPLQIAAMLIVGGRSQVFSEAPSLIIFLVVLLALSVASFHLFERPAQTRLRRVLGLQRGNG